MQGGAEAAPWTPETPASLRAGWTPDGKLNSTPTILLDGETMASWVDVQGDYTLDTLGSAAPTGDTLNTAVVAAFNGSSQSIGTGAIGSFPTDAAGTIGMLVRTPANTLSGRDFDTMVSFSHLTTTNQQILLCLRRISTVLYFGVAAQNSGAGVSSWYGSTTGLTTNTWYDVLYTFSGSALTITVNGTSQTVTEVSTPSATVGQFLSAVSCNNVSLGARHWPSASYAEFWSTAIDQVWWYSEVLSAGDLTNLQSHLATRRGVV